MADAAAAAAYEVVYSGLLFSRPRPVVSNQLSSRVKFQFVKISRPLVRQSFPLSRLVRCATAGRNGRERLLSDEGFEHEPFWSSLVKDAVWGFRALAVFLAEQPSQLKYIEWPTFQSTLKTACLTLILVALLIVALCSIDSALCYILAWLLRKSA
ncbi:uncharacterized protein LOC109723246 [Ananas comosus]|uniref:Uncharacterized protein LOC109723246 n=1 Tax=Ananas comosus TaxID=4615 RepID=A0A6P5GP15_ANACO|nr:uncharacterized protein LOC109723246 [Ananas comosus]